MRLFILILAITCAYGIRLPDKLSNHPCDEVVCRAGRECVDVDGVGKCLCTVTCPDHFRPVCGSNGDSYDSHCKLHQHACLTGNHIRVKHKGFCKKTFKTQKEKDSKHALLSKLELENIIENDLLNDFHKVEKKQLKQHDLKVPAVCFTSQRDALRFLLVSHWEDTLKDQPWHVDGMTYRESLWGWFYACDTDKNNYLTAEELLTCAKKVSFFARPGQDTDLTKALCIDAIVDDADQNRDFRLSFEEFTRVMNQRYHPKQKDCSLEGKSYKDGADVTVECNHCICAVGNWVCNSVDCIADKDGKKKHPKDFFGYADIVDNAISNDITTSIFEDQKEEEAEEEEETKGPVEDSDEDELAMDDYYDDFLYEKTKSKKKAELESALEEIKALKKRTQVLNEFWKKQIAHDVKEEHYKQKKYLKKMNFKKTKKNKKYITKKNKKAKKNLDLWKDSKMSKKSNYHNKNSNKF